MGREEQQEEREVLDSIFPDEITDISDTAYRISITLDVANEDGDDSEPPTVLLSVSYPEEYPDVAPDLDLSAPHNAPKHPLFDISDDKKVLLEALEPTIEENMGMAMIFTLVSTLKDGAELLISERQAAARALHEQEIQKAEEAENAKFHGTPVTPETFLEWRERFKQEMEEEERRREQQELEERKKKGVKDENRLTGRELWERGLAGKMDEEEGDEVDAMERLKVEE